MNYAQLDHIADAVDPLLAIGVIVGALYLQRAAAWNFLLRATIATLLVQQSAKLIQKFGPLGGDFPSTHFAVRALFRHFFGVAAPQVLGALDGHSGSLRRANVVAALPRAARTYGRALRDSRRLVFCDIQTQARDGSRAKLIKLSVRG